MSSHYSIIIPAYNEAENIPSLIKRLFKVLNQEKPAVTIVDKDSSDGTQEAVQKLSEKFTVKLIVDTRSLSEAVVRGFKQSQGDILLVMDADLSHPPEKIPELLEKLEEADLVVGKRRKVENWPAHRKLVSYGASFLARPLTSVSDPMSGFFALRKEVIENVELNPIGYKILLEILVKGRYKKIAEVPYVFQNRERGESKLNLKEYWSYLRHLFRLYKYKLIERLRD